MFYNCTTCIANYVIFVSLLHVLFHGSSVVLCWSLLYSSVHCLNTILITSEHKKQYLFVLGVDYHVVEQNDVGAKYSEHLVKCCSVSDVMS